MSTKPLVLDAIRECYAKYREMVTVRGGLVRDVTPDVISLTFNLAEVTPLLINEIDRLVAEVDRLERVVQLADTARTSAPGWVAQPSVVDLPLTSSDDWSGDDVCVSSAI